MEGETSLNGIVRKDRFSESALGLPARKPGPTANSTLSPLNQNTSPTTISFPASYRGGSSDSRGDQQLQPIRNYSCDIELNRSTTKENISPFQKKFEDKSSDIQEKPQQLENKNAMLLAYLEQMKRRRVELEALVLRPAWALMPVDRIQNTKYATDEESKKVGNILHDFFNGSTSPRTDEETHQEAPSQHKTGRDDLLLDIAEPDNTSQAETERTSSTTILALAPKLREFKHTTFSLMLEGLGQRSRVFGSGDKTEKLPTQEAKQPVNFLSLDDKLRERIWTLALQYPRIIELTRSATYSVRSRATVPALLHTCQESRAIAKKHYSLSFAPPETSPKVYFDFDHDWLYTRCGGCLGMDCNHKLTLTEDHCKLKNLIFEGPMSCNPFHKIIKFYPNIKNLILVRGRSTAQRNEIKKTDISIVHEKFEWAFKVDLLPLAEKTWKELDKSGGSMPLKHIWRATLPDTVNVKRSHNLKKGLWTCCT